MWVDMNRIRSDCNIFFCKICHKWFDSNTKLAQHAKIHDGLRPFTCQICHKKFGALSILSQHLRRIHEQINQETSVCSNCDKEKDNQHIIQDIYWGKLCLDCNFIKSKMVPMIFSHDIVDNNDNQQADDNDDIYA